MEKKILLLFISILFLSCISNVDSKEAIIKNKNELNRERKLYKDFTEFISMKTISSHSFFKNSIIKEKIEYFKLFIEIIFHSIIIYHQLRHVFMEIKQ